MELSLVKRVKIKSREEIEKTIREGITPNPGFVPSMYPFCGTEVEVRPDLYEKNVFCSNVGIQWEWHTEWFEVVEWHDQDILAELEEMLAHFLDLRER